MADLDYGQFMQIEIDTANRIYKSDEVKKRIFLRDQLKKTKEQRIAYMKRLNPSFWRVLWDDFLLVSYYVGSEVTGKDPNIIEGLDEVNKANCNFRNGVAFWSNAIPLMLKVGLFTGILIVTDKVGL